MNNPSSSHSNELLDVSMEPEVGDDKKPTGVDLTKMFLSGEINFDDYSNQWNEVDDYSSDNEDNFIAEEVENSSNTGVKKTRRRNTTKLGPALLGLMGEANLRFVKGDKQTAEKICYEIIRQVPNSPEPYQTLAQIYECDPEMSFKFSLLAAHLGQTDVEEWIKLRDFSLKKEDFKQAIMCYTKIIRAQPECPQHHLSRLELIEKLDTEGFNIKTLSVSIQTCYFQIVKYIPATEMDIIIKYAKLGLSIYHKNNDADKAVEIMEIAYKKCSQAFIGELLNMFLELLISYGRFERCLEVLVESAGVVIVADVLTMEVDGNVEEKTQYVRCTFPEELPLDLKTKLLVCFIHLRAISVVVDLLETCLNQYLEKDGDLFIDIEEALTSVGEHNAALRILKLLIKSEAYNLPGVWLKYADCLNMLGLKEEAADAYRIVMKDAPHYSSVRIKLKAILEETGSTEEILETLDQDYSIPINHTVLYERYKVLKKSNCLAECLKVGEILLSPTFFKFCSSEEYKYYKSHRSYHDNVPTVRKSLGIKADIVQFEEDSIVQFTVSEEWSIFKELLLIAKDLKKYEVMERLAFSALGSKNLVEHRADIEFMCLTASLLNRDFHNAFVLVREIFIKNPDSTAAWNLAYLYLNLSKDTRVQKNFIRLVKNTSEKFNPYLELMKGNRFFMTHQTALNHYLTYYSKTDDPLGALLLGASFIQMAYVRTVKQHHQVLFQGLGFLSKYKSIRCCDQEVFFNFGRVYQHLNLNNLAIDFYERALACKPGEHCEEHDFINLQCETAYNLFLLYKKNSPRLALTYLHKYIVI